MLASLGILRRELAAGRLVPVLREAHGEAVAEDAALEAQRRARVPALGERATATPAKRRSGRR